MEESNENKVDESEISNNRPDLDMLRGKINAVDSEICRLFADRMDIALQIAEYKKANGLAVLDGERERAVLTRVSEAVGDKYAEYADLLYRSIMELSRRYQHTVMNSDSEISLKFAKAIETTPKIFPKSARVLCQGCEGAYSQAAAEKLFASPNIKFVSSFDEVFKSVESGEYDYGILPIENSTAGSVNMIYDLLVKYDAKIVRSVRVKVDHNLLAPIGANIDDIKEIYSHPQAIDQCSHFLAELSKKNNIKIIPYENTASAAKMVAMSKDKTKAALSSSHCASIYHLSMLAGGVQNSDGNFTRFICIAKKPMIFPGSNRTSVMMILPHRRGALFSVMSSIQAAGVNLIKLESRPVPGSDFGFMFYFDIEESMYSENLPMLLTELQTKSDYFKYLGTYLEQI